MKDNETLVYEWYKKSVNPKDLDKKIIATLDYFKRVQFPDDDSDNRWTVWGYEIVNGTHGKNTVPVFLDEILHQGEKHYTKKQGAPSLKKIKENFKEVKRLVAENFEQTSKLRGTFKVSHNEADGSLGVFYVEYK